LIFPTIEFGIFFAIVLPLSWLLIPRPSRWKPFMIAASYVFYGWWDWRFVGLIAGSTLVNQFFAEAIYRTTIDRWRRAWLWAAVAANLGVLGYFKYYGFLVSSVEDAFDSVHIHVPLTLVQLALPVGISFFTFQALSYVIDIYRKELRPAPLLDFAVFLSFFPHVVAGPIVRAAEFLPQLHRRPDPRRVDASRAFWLIFAGLFKKVVLANFLATKLVDPVFASPHAHSGFEALMAIYGYAVQIYADFSGYTDIAIGVALLLGFQFPQNFNAPYTALDLQDFWRRWHMTLSRWLRDYLYIPLGGSRGGLWDTCRNLMITMVLGGLWHGANWTFVIWGSLHGGGLVWQRVRQDRRAAAGLPPPPDTPSARFWRRMATFQFVCFAWVFFRADSMRNVAEVLGRLLHWGGGSPLITWGVIAAIACGILSQYVPDRVPETLQAMFSRLAPAFQGLTLAVLLVTIDTLGPQGVAPFIYFRF
jgi:D-alanyl-lipoteichoic acid acyltransferase DltB (MBOAT superfamily)